MGSVRRRLTRGFYYGYLYYFLLFYFWYRKCQEPPKLSSRFDLTGGTAQCVSFLAAVVSSKSHNEFACMLGRPIFGEGEVLKVDFTLSIVRGGRGGGCVHLRIFIWFATSITITFKIGFPAILPLISSETSGRTDTYGRMGSKIFWLSGSDARFNNV